VRFPILTGFCFFLRQATNAVSLMSQKMSHNPVECAEVHGSDATISAVKNVKIEAMTNNVSIISRTINNNLIIPQPQKLLPLERRTK